MAPAARRPNQTAARLSSEPAVARISDTTVFALQLQVGRICHKYIWKHRLGLRPHSGLKATRRGGGGVKCLFGIKLFIYHK